MITKLEKDDFRSVNELLTMDVINDTEADMYLESGAPLYVFSGDLKFDGDVRSADVLKGQDGFDPPKGKNPHFGIVVVGNIAVDGSLRIDQYHDLFVSGNVSAKSVTAHSANMIVAGDVFASDLICFQSTSEGGVFFASNCKAPMLIHFGSLDWNVENAAGKFISNVEQTDPLFLRIQESLETLGVFDGTYNEEWRGVETVINSGCADILVKLADGNATSDDIRSAKEKIAVFESTSTPALEQEPAELVQRWIEADNLWRRDDEPERNDRIPDDAFYVDGLWCVFSTDSENRLEGEHRALDYSGELFSVAHYERGLLQGPWNSYYSADQPFESRTYVDGRLHGPWKRYDRDGTVETRDYLHDMAVRKPGVPEDAIWNASVESWIIEPLNDAGEYDGVAKYYRSFDGSLACEATFKKGILDGEGRRFHNNGEVSQIFIYKKGKIASASHFRCSTETSEPPMTADENIVRIDVHYRKGKPTGQTHFDRDNQEVSVKKPLFNTWRKVGVVV